MAHLTLGNENSEKKESQEKSYFQQRMEKYGITNEHNCIDVWANENVNGEHKDKLISKPIFIPTEDGSIKIMAIDADRNEIKINKKGSRFKETYYSTRHAEPKKMSDGSFAKMTFPPGATPPPGIFNKVIKALEDKTHIEVLFIVEGDFKAFKICMAGGYAIAIKSVTLYNDKETKKIHGDILRVIKTCEPKRVEILVDGDALNISLKALEEGKDLVSRPKTFFNLANNLKNQLKDENVEVTFSYPKSHALAEKFGKSKDDLKGPDDILIALPEKQKDILKCLASPNSSDYFEKIDITYEAKKLWRHFRLHDVNEFVLFHAEQYPELLHNQFKWHGGTYKWDEKEEKCIEVSPAAAEMFIRIGDDYFKIILKPNKYGHLEKVLIRLNKTTIIDDYGKKFLKSIKKFDAPCIVPDNKNFNQVIGTCWNLYSPLDYLPAEQTFDLIDLPAINKFLRHIAAERKAFYVDQKTKAKIEVSVLEMLLDYLQILYLNPEQKLPVFCLVSEENNTGKSTFAFLLRKIFGANVAIVGNDDLAGNFNSHWISKLVVVCDETMIEKRIVLEKIKSLSTATKVFMNAKGRDQVELDCFMKFVLITNNEENFIYASKEDIRYWILKVPVLKEVDIDILARMEDEIPGFLSFLNNRKLVTERKNRMHFHPDLLKTDALNRVIEFSQPGVEKDIRHFLREMFLDTGLQTIEMSQKAIHQEALGGKQNANYVEKILKKNMGLLPYHVWLFAGREYESKEEAFFYAKEKNPGLADTEILSLVEQKFKTKRYSYPKNIVDYSTGSATMKRIQVEEVGRPYIFKRSDFVKENDEVEPSPENKFLSEIFEGNNSTPTYKADEVPFPILGH